MNTWIDRNMLTNTIESNEYDLPVLIRGDLKIEWVNLDEGISGDYDETDPDDVNLLRFDVYRLNLDNGGWEPIEDGSYCTLVHHDAPKEELIKHLQHFMDTIYDDVSSHGKAKRLCEALSWTK
jgi:hypothetical protein